MATPSSPRVYRIDVQFTCQTDSWLYTHNGDTVTLKHPNGHERTMTLAEARENWKDAAAMAHAYNRFSEAPTPCPF